MLSTTIVDKNKSCFVRVRDGLSKNIVTKLPVDFSVYGIRGTTLDWSRESSGLNALHLFLSDKDCRFPILYGSMLDGGVARASFELLAQGFYPVVMVDGLISTSPIQAQSAIHRLRFAGVICMASQQLKCEFDLQN